MLTRKVVAVTAALQGALLLGCSGEDAPFGEGEPDHDRWTTCVPLDASAGHTAWLGTAFYFNSEDAALLGLESGTTIEVERIDYEVDPLLTVVDVSMRREQPLGAELFESPDERTRRREELDVRSLPARITVESDMAWSLAIEVAPNPSTSGLADEEPVIGRVVPSYVYYEVDGHDYRSPLHGSLEVAMTEGGEPRCW